MAHEDLKDVLGHAGNFPERVEGVRAAIRLGIPLNHIEEYLDWLDLVRKTGHTEGG